MRRLYGLLAALGCLALSAVCLYAIWRYWGFIPGDYHYPNGDKATRRAEIVQAEQWSVLAWASGVPAVLLAIVTGIFAADDREIEEARLRTQSWRAETERIRVKRMYPRPEDAPKPEPKPDPPPPPDGTAL